MKFLDEIVFDNTIKAYLIEATIILMALLCRKIISKTIASLVFIPIKKKWQRLNKNEFIALTIKPLSWFIVIVIVVFSLEKLKYPTKWDFDVHGITLLDVLKKTGTIATIISFFYFLETLIDFIALLLEQNNSTTDKSHGQVLLFFRDLLKVFVGIVGLLLVIKYAFNQNIGTLLTGLSIVGAALALAAKESIENLIASFIIFFDKPFFIGDNVHVDAIYGKVEHIGLRSTRIRTLEKTLVTVPNKLMVDGVVDNMSMRNKWRVETKLILSENTKPAALKKLIEQINTLLKAEEKNITKYNVIFSDYNKDGIVLYIEYFTLPFTKSEYDDTKQKINFSLLSILEKHNVALSSNKEATTIPQKIELP